MDRGVEILSFGLPVTAMMPKQSTHEANAADRPLEAQAEDVPAVLNVTHCPWQKVIVEDAQCGMAVPLNVLPNFFHTSTLQIGIRLR